MRVDIVPLWNDIDIPPRASDTQNMPRTRMDELVALAEENDGLLTSKQAREAGILDSVLVRLAQRGRLERTARGVYRISRYPQARHAQYREAVLWAGASQGPKNVALSHETAFAIYGISDANPSVVHITVPKLARLRREQPRWIAIHREDLAPEDVVIHEGLPITSIAKTASDILTSTGRTDLVRQAIADARKEGYIGRPEAERLKRQAMQFAQGADHSLPMKESHR
jgi:predicted transcriptional regulator of viral defense system